MNKKRNNIYYILTYLFFIYPPFIWGLVLIYNENNTRKEHITSLWINLILLVVIGLVCLLLIYTQKLHKPETKEIKYLIFGLIGNIVVYFYTFQNALKIDDFVTIYLILLVVLSVHYLLLSRKFSAIELWLLLPLFLVVDIIHYIATGCGYTDGSICYSSVNMIIPYFLYIIFLTCVVGYYIYRIYLLNQFNLFKYINIFLVAFMSIFFQDLDILDDKVMLTAAILLPFFTIVDFIVHIVNKKYQHKILIFYIRTYTLLFIFMLIGTMSFFQGEANYEVLNIMVTVTYISLFISILKSVLKIEESHFPSFDVQVEYRLCTKDCQNKIRKEFGETAFLHASIEEGHYTLLAIKEESILGFISIYATPMKEPLNVMSEGYIEILQVKDEQTDIAKTLLLKAEKHFSKLDIYQLRGWCRLDCLFLEKVWNQLGYSYCPGGKHSEDTTIKGFYVTKRL